MSSPEDKPRRSTWSLVLRAGTVTSALLLLALLVYGLVAQNPNTRIAEGLARAEAVRAPEFELPVLQRGDLGPELTRKLRAALRDDRIALSELRGTPVVLNFWASWCVPCREEAPTLERGWRKDARPRGVLFLGLDMQDIEGDARAFIREFDVSYLNVRDRRDDVARAYGVTGIPETFFIDGRGRAVGHVVGVVSQEQLRQGIDAARRGQIVGQRQGGDQRSTR